MKVRAPIEARAKRMQQRLAFLYGPSVGRETWTRLARRLSAYLDLHPRATTPLRTLPLDQGDALLISYGDQFTAAGEPPLATLERFLERIKGFLPGLHLLPHYPYSSDGGFSVIDYRTVDPQLGGWSEVEAIARRHPLMLDAVINHISARSPWFSAYREGRPPYDRYFIEPEPRADLSQVVRPRALPLLSTFSTLRGPRRVWTTFSDDQVDLNYKNPAVLLEVLEVLLSYAAAGARLLRLDAVGFLWKEPGTTCLHLPQTHAVIKLIRDVLDAVAPQVLLITETNVPHPENVAYFGDGYDEAQLVYNFSLPPLVLYAIHTADAGRLSVWAQGLEVPSPRTAFFNFLASHDGIGLRPAEGILEPREIARLAELTLAHGGAIGERNTPRGPKPYELNITFYDALNSPDAGLDLGVARFLAAHAIMLALAGLPGVYVHSLFGTSSDQQGYRETGVKRRLNRKKFSLAEVEATLARPDSRSARVFSGMGGMFAARAGMPAFSPGAHQEVLFLDPRVFALKRTPEDGAGPVYALVNISNEHLRLLLPQMDADLVTDRLSNQTFTRSAGGIQLDFRPYQVRWLET